jgi:putative ABC transport system permease protein
MDQRSRTVAILKCLGAPADVIFKSYLIQVGMMAFTASLIGASIGSAIPLVFAPIFSNVLGLNINWYLDVETFFLALAYGLLTAFVFTLWPLAAAERLHPADLVRGSALGIAGIRPNAKRLALIVLAAIGLIFMAVYMASSKFIAFVFITGAIFAAF